MPRVVSSTLRVPPRRPAQLLARLGAALAVVAALSATGIEAAGAHAVLEQTSPGADAVLADAPDAVELRFTEAVDPGLGGVKVIASDGARVDRGRVDRLDGGRLVRVPVDEGEQGTFTVAWSVVSDDGHSIAGSFLYSVGRVTGAADAGGGTRPAVRLLAGVGRWGGFAGLLLVVGGIAFARLVLERDADAERGRLRRVLLAGALLAVAGAGCALVAQVALVAGRSLPASLGLVPEAVTGSRFGALAALRSGVAASIAGLFVVRRVAVAKATDAAVAVLAIALAVLTASSGHGWTTTPRWAAVGVDVVHLVAAGAWIGGLAALVVVAARSPAAAVLAERFSRLAAVAVATVVATGMASSYLQVRSVDGLTDTGYGRLLLLKVALVAAVVLLGWVNRRRLVARLPDRATLFTVVRAELALAVVVVAVTAALVNRPPARADLLRPFSATAALAGDPAGGDVEVEVAPAKAGPNDVHLYFLSPAGLPRPVDAVELTVEAPGVPARRVAVLPVTADHASAYRVLLPSPGRWTFTVVAVHRGATGTARLEVPIR